ncbi:hypothetical protein [Leptolyngbya sp. 7M]|uniref:hypothetical protein n=1 Tax=Leptolyngbya sp. 7M TaxID=2812896 RepID=UPI001B8BBB9C|nr:hypothetical protein [Leptolyngbya sp. 7M]QYO63106.1 hypothetical protein JVX88_24515 [Leptolyngbya sp. 7M]QYU70095.1 hypothetical protein J4558_08240 [Leptolyngbya sp. 15MV]
MRSAAWLLQSAASLSSLRELVARSRETDDPEGLYNKLVNFVRTGDLPQDIDRPEIFTMFSVASASPTAFPDLDVDDVLGAKLTCSAAMLVALSTRRLIIEEQTSSICRVFIESVINYSTEIIFLSAFFLCQAIGCIRANINLSRCEQACEEMHEDLCILRDCQIFLLSMCILKTDTLDFAEATRANAQAVVDPAALEGYRDTLARATKVLQSQEKSPLDAKTL